MAKYSLKGPVTLFPSGLSTCRPDDAGYALGVPDPSFWHVWFDDFDDYDANQWVITTTETGSASASEAVSSIDEGILLITNDNADNDNDFFQWSGVTGTGVVETFKFVTGKKLFFKSRWKTSDATQSDIVMGLQITDTSPLAVTDGIYFQKDDGDANLDVHVTKNSTSSDGTAISTLVDNTYVETAFYYNGVDSIEVFVDNVKIDTLGVTNLPDDEDLAISFGIQNGEAAAKTLSVDYILVAKERGNT